MLGKYPVPTENELLALAADEQMAVRLDAACRLAHELYDDKLTVVGLPALEHALCVAQTLLEFGLGAETVIAGVFSHVMLPAEIARIEQAFGREVAQLVRGLRNLDIYTQQATMRTSERTLEAVRRALLSMNSGDVRVVVIRLAMALHTLRRADSLPELQRQLVARDVMNIYAPLANRLGIWQFKWELEDLAFRHLQPEEYEAIADALDEQREARHRRVESAKRLLEQELTKLDIQAEVTGRPKHIYSIYRKMKRKKIDFSGIFDAHAVRVIIAQDEPERPGLSDEERRQRAYIQCYRALGIVHSIWEPIPSEFDDYIQHPKSNGYRSLHTAVLDEDGRRLEVQIRTRAMHIEAEQGLAAHWAYKEGGRPSAALVREVESLRQLLATLSTTEIEALQLEPVNGTAKVVPERVYVFTPTGDVIDLPYGATPVDFAYAIHTEIGHRCRSAIVNGKIVSLTYKLRSGDLVKINTSARDKPGHPSRDWMNPHAGYTGTTKARNRVRQWFRVNQREQNIEYGRQYLDRELKRLKVVGDVPHEALAAQFEQPLDEFLARIGFGDISLKQIEGGVALILRDRREALAAAGDGLLEKQPLRQEHSKSTKGLTVMGMSGLHTHMAQCCSPIPPEPIVGYVTRGRGVTIHRADCSQIVTKRQTEPERVVSADWGSGSGGRFAVPFRLKAYRSANLLEKIATTLRGQNINLLKTKATNSGKRHVSVYLLAEVSDMAQASWIEQKLQGLETVFEVVSR